jgi:hypothetical protein
MDTARKASVDITPDGSLVVAREPTVRIGVTNISPKFSCDRVLVETALRHPQNGVVLPSAAATSLVIGEAGRLGVAFRTFYSLGSGASVALVEPAKSLGPTGMERST